MYGRPPMYNPRPYTPTISAPFRPNLMTQPPGYIPQPMGYQSKFRPQMQMPIPHTIIPQSSNEIYLSVYIGDIPEGITDEFIEQILKVCGNVRSWKRVIDSTGQKKNFGICEFEGFEVLFRALRVIGGEANKELGKEESGCIELPTDDENVTMQHVSFIIDNSTRSYITKNSKPRNPYDLEKDKECLKSIEELISKLVEEKKKKIEEKKTKDGETNKLTAEQEESINKEIREIRDQTLQEKDKHDSEYDRKRRRDYDSSSWRNDSADEEEEERRRQERREKEMEQVYRERVKRWENREYDKMKDYELDQLDEEEYAERRKKEREIYMERLANYDDDVERDRAEHEYYYDRNRWWSHRKSYLSREAKEDDIDRRREMEENEERMKKEIKLDYGSAENEPMPVIPKRTEEPKPQPKSEPEMIVGRIMTAEERKEAIEKIISAIPNDKDALWKWDVQWNYIDETLLKEKIIPFVGKKIKEYFGEEEKELVDFIVSYIKNHNTAEQLYNELKPALAEEAEVFVMIIWRMVIYETEYRKQGLN
ncbi:hypothetical protein BCR36DRAFT_580151 [Piromyces finnis]|uniref:PWI domain-containing protein n=1 Tax=Piromyces finnis TaxID=1754191 RepID=A0A1Y1VL99_9FUNG|nr:hypothetical protein BCR36DRAFT_580151 [Piromyces finnis]|eukprot:ORX58539.1 hypothetical protein BCR36DRAFT_580151 [Piromyces finnis]